MLFFFNDTATTEICTLSLHDALPILGQRQCRQGGRYRLVDSLGNTRWKALFGVDAGRQRGLSISCSRENQPVGIDRLEVHTSELQSHSEPAFLLVLV